MPHAKPSPTVSFFSVRLPPFAPGGSLPQQNALPPSTTAQLELPPTLSSAICTPAGSPAGGCGAELAERSAAVSRAGCVGAGARTSATAVGLLTLSAIVADAVSARAVMRAVPSLSAVTRPVGSTNATVGLSERHAAALAIGAPFES